MTPFQKIIANGGDVSGNLARFLADGAVGDHTDFQESFEGAASGNKPQNLRSAATTLASTVFATALTLIQR